MQEDFRHVNGASDIHNSWNKHWNSFFISQLITLPVTGSISSKRATMRTLSFMKSKFHTTLRVNGQSNVSLSTRIYQVRQHRLDHSLQIRYLLTHPGILSVHGSILKSLNCPSMHTWARQIRKIFSPSSADVLRPQRSLRCRVTRISRTTGTWPGLWQRVWVNPCDFHSLFLHLNNLIFHRTIYVYSLQKRLWPFLIKIESSSSMFGRAHLRPGCGSYLGIHIYFQIFNGMLNESISTMGPLLCGWLMNPGLQMLGGNSRYAFYSPSIL